jgi:hypothetical protein
MSEDVPPYGRAEDGKPLPQGHPARESKRAIFLHGYLPAITAGLIFAASVLLDLKFPGNHWAQRSGSIVTALGGYVAYYGVKPAFKWVDEGDFFMNFYLPYPKIAAAMVTSGTLVWGYLDLWL